MPPDAPSDSRLWHSFCLPPHKQISSYGHVACEPRLSVWPMGSVHGQRSLVAGDGKPGSCGHCERELIAKCSEPDPSSRDSLPYGSLASWNESSLVHVLPPLLLTNVIFTHQRYGWHEIPAGCLNLQLIPWTSIFPPSYQPLVL